ncbi:MAG: hypothetical protein MI976_10855 [Pseudomonadales bacterium]|nr:hypothetical protein [Pseudomonadales bacterium]
MQTSQLLYDLKIYSDVTGEILGYVISIDDDGLTMVADQAIDLEKENFFAMENILELEPGQKALFAAVCDNCSLDDETTDCFHVHLKFTQMSSVASELQRVLH